MPTLDSVRNHFSGKVPATLESYFQCLKYVNGRMEVGWVLAVIARSSISTVSYRIRNYSISVNSIDDTLGLCIALSRIETRQSLHSGWPSNSSLSRSQSIWTYSIAVVAKFSTTAVDHSILSSWTMCDTSYGTSSSSFSARLQQGITGRSLADSRKQRTKYLSQISRSSLACCALVMLETLSHL